MNILKTMCVMASLMICAQDYVQVTVMLDEKNPDTITTTYDKAFTRSMPKSTALVSRDNKGRQVIIDKSLITSFYDWPLEKSQWINNKHDSLVAAIFKALQTRMSELKKPGDKIILSILIPNSIDTNNCR